MWYSNNNSVYKFKVAVIMNVVYSREFIKSLIYLHALVFIDPVTRGFEILGTLILLWR